METKKLTEQVMEKVWHEDKVREARQKIDICYMLSDVINSYLIDINWLLGKYNLRYNSEHRMEFNFLKQNIKNAKVMSNKLSKMLLTGSNYDLACEESDLLAKMIYTIEQRIPQDAETFKQTYQKMTAMIELNFPNLFVTHQQKQYE